MNLKQIFSSWGCKDPNIGLKDSTIEMPWNIYNGKIMKDHVRTFHNLHYVLKYKLIVPFLKLIQHIIDKHIQLDIPDEPYNKNLRIFNMSFEKSIDDWVDYFNKVNPRTVMLGTKYNPEQMRKSYAVNALRTCKDLVIAGALNDTAYREFFNIMIYNLMNDFIKSYPDKKIKHLFYDAPGVYDVGYYVIWRAKFNQDAMQYVKKVLGDKKNG